MMYSKRHLPDTEQWSRAVAPTSWPSRPKASYIRTFPGLAERGVLRESPPVQEAPPLAEPHAGQIASALLPALAAGGNLLV